ncbi:MAG: hypothetical protein ACI4Q3_06690 [Kiritimatiellia bacterium]
MKKLMTALCLVGSLCAFSQEAAAKPEEADRPKVTQEQRKAQRERFQAEMKARREATQQKIVEILKGAGLDEAKAKEVAGQIEKAYREGRSPRRHGGPGARGARRPAAAPKDKAPAGEAK